MTSPAELLRRTGDLIDRSLSQRFQVPQDAGLLTLDPTLADRVLGTLTRNRRAFARRHPIFRRRRHDAAVRLRPLDPGRGRPRFRRPHRDRRDPREPAGRKERRNTWKIASEADRAVSRATRSLVSLEARRASCSASRSRSAAGSTLATRSRSAANTCGCGSRWCAPAIPQGAAAGTLKRFSDLIAILRRERICPFLRIDDRLELRQLQETDLRAARRRRRRSPSRPPAGCARTFPDSSTC